MNSIKNNYFIIILLAPFVSFINNNYTEISNIFFTTILLIFAIITIAVIFLSEILSKFTDIKKKNFYLFLSIFFYILFDVYNTIKSTLFSIIAIEERNAWKYFHGEVSFIICIILAILIGYVIFKEKFKKILVFYFTFILINLFLNLFLITYKFNYDTKSSSLVKEIKKKSSNENIKNNKKNIYLIIFDAAVPIEKFDALYETNYYNENIDFYKENGFIYSKGNKSAYNNTKHNLASFFYLDYHIDENNYKLVKPNNVWPHFLKKNSSNYLPFLEVLKENRYKFVHFGNMFNDCYSVNDDFCLEKNNKKIKNYYFSSYISFSFINRSPVFPIFKRIEALFSNQKFTSTEIKYVQSFYNKNDSLNRFMYEINESNLKINNKGYFFLIHSIMPHGPYIYNSDCSFNNDLMNVDLNDPLLKDKKIFETTFNYDLYKNSYSCMLKRIKEFIFFLNNKDPDANVIITADHGTPIIERKEDKINFKNTPFNGYDVLFMYKLNGSLCKKDFNTNFNMINAGRKILECSFGINLNKAEKRSYFVVCNPKIITHCEYKVHNILSEKDEFESYLKYNK